MGIVINDVVCSFDVRNTNGRVYNNNESMKKAVSEYIEKTKQRSVEDESVIGKSIMLGELDHCSEHFVTLNNVSHRVNNIKFGDGEIFCDVELLDTPRGKIAKQVIDAGIPLKLAPRMTFEYIYELDENGNKTDKIIGVEYKDIISFDLVK